MGQGNVLHESVILFTGLGEDWLPSMHHWWHDRGGVFIQEREGVCIWEGLHPGERSVSRGGVCIQGERVCIQCRGLHPGEGSVSRWGVCIQCRGLHPGEGSVSRGGVCIQGRGLHPMEGSVSRGRGSASEGRGSASRRSAWGERWEDPLVHLTPPLLPEFGKQVVHLLLKSCLVHKSNETKWLQ